MKNSIPHVVLSEIIRSFKANCNYKSTTCKYKRIKSSKKLGGFAK